MTVDSPSRHSCLVMEEFGPLLPIALNMAVVMPFSGYYIYKYISGKAPLNIISTGGQRGYSRLYSLVLAAACTGFMFGMSPCFIRAWKEFPSTCPMALRSCSSSYAHCSIYLDTAFWRQ